MGAAVQKGDQVAIHYKGRLTDETEFDSSEGRDPLEFTAGGAELISGVSQAVIGMAVGEKKTVEVAPEEGYGPRNDELVIQVPSEQLPQGVQAGTMLSDGQGNHWVVLEAGESECKLDGNHPLAGKTLIFEIELVSIG